MLLCKVDSSEITIQDTRAPVVYGHRTHFLSKYYLRSHPIINIRTGTIPVLRGPSLTSPDGIYLPLPTGSALLCTAHFLLCCGSLSVLCVL